MIARIRVGGRDDENSTAYLLLRMAGARRYQWVFGRYGFDHVMACEVFGGEPPHP
jgi:hypothetical protein